MNGLTLYEINFLLFTFFYKRSNIENSRVKTDQTPPFSDEF